MSQSAAMKRTVEKTVLTGFIVLLALLGIVGVVSRRTVLGLIEDTRWVAHSHHVIHLLDRLSFQIAQSEDAARGYVITQDPIFQFSYRQLRAGRPPLLDDVRQETADNLSEQKSIQASLDAHKLAGSLGSFGLNAAAEIAQEIETLFSANGATRTAEAVPISSRRSPSLQCNR